MTVEANLLMYRQSSANDKYVKTAGGILIDTDAPTGGSGGSSSSGGMIGQASFDSGAGAISNLVVAGIVSTVTRLAVGKYAVVFAAPQPDVNYAAHMTASDDNSDPVWTYYSGLAADYTVNGFTFYVYGNGNPKDQFVVRLSIFRYGAGGGSFSLPDIDLINFWPSSALKATASSTYTGGNVPPIAGFVRGTGSGVGWLSNGIAASWLKIEFPSAMTMKSYAVMPWSTDTYPGRTPKTWTFEGSNDDSAWTVLDTQTNFTAWTRWERVAFTTTNTTAYKWYRINVTVNQGDAYTGVGGIWLYGQPPVTSSTTSGGVDAPPSTPNAMDDEGTGTSLDSKWTIIDLGSITASVTKDYGNNSWMSFSCPSSIQNRIFAITQPAPAGTYKIRTKMAFDSATGNYFGLQLIARRASVTKSVVAGPMYHSSYGVPTMYATRINEPSTLVTDTDLYDIRSDIFYLELEYDGTNLIWRTSKTGAKYTRFYQETTAAHLGAAPESVGINFHFYGGSSDANHIMCGSMDWFRRVA